MASQQQEQLNAKQQAVLDLEAARASMAQHGLLVVEEWSPRALLGRSFEKHRVWWLSGALVAGLLIIRGFRSSPPNYNGPDKVITTAKNRRLFAFILGPALALGRRKLVDHGTRLLESYFSHKFSPNASASKEV